MKRYLRLALTTCLSVLLHSCRQDENFVTQQYTTESVKQPSRMLTEENRNVLLIVTAGFNSLSDDLTQDQLDLYNGYVPKRQTREDHVLLILSRIPKNAFSTTNAPVLYRMYTDSDLHVVRDTLKQWEQTTPLSSAKTINEALSYIQKNFPAKGYGMVFSSHASGWIPKSSTKSIGQDVDMQSKYEIDLDEFSSAIPFRMDYILLDACLTGSVEVAWELKDKTDIIGFSPTEILSDGFEYTTITQHLLKDTPDPVAVCKEYFHRYESRNSSASITVVDTRKMEPFAETCRNLFEKYRDALKTVPPSSIQYYFDRNKTPNYAYMYDIIDMMQKTGITNGEMEQLQESFDNCILYFKTTDWFLNIPMYNAHGLSMYLPSSGNAQMDEYYMEHIQWNRDTQLLKQALN